MNVLPSDKTLRNYSSLDKSQIIKPHSPFPKNDISTRQPIKGQYRFLSDTPYISNVPNSLSNPKFENPLKQAKYNLQKNQIESKEQFNYYSLPQSSQVTPKKGIRFDGFGKQEPNLLSDIYNQQLKNINYAKNHQTTSVIHPGSNQKEGGAKKQSNISSLQPGRSKIEQLILSHAQTFSPNNEGNEDNNITSSENLKKTLPLSENRGEINQIKNVIQQMNFAVKKSGKLAQSAFEVENLQKVINTLESIGEKLSKKELQNLRSTIESLFKNASKASLIHSDNPPKVRLLLIFYLYVLKLLQTYDNQKRTSALEIYMDDLTNTDLSGLISLSQTLKPYSHLSMTDWDKIDSLVKEDNKDNSGKAPQTPKPAPPKPAQSSVSTRSQSIKKQSKPDAQPQEDDEEAEGGGLIKEFKKWKKKTNKKEKSDQKKGLPTDKQSKKNFKEMDKILDKPQKKGGKKKLLSHDLQ